MYFSVCVAEAILSKHLCHAYMVKSHFQHKLHDSFLDCCIELAAKCGWHCHGSSKQNNYIEVKQHIWKKKKKRQTQDAQ